MVKSEEVVGYIKNLSSALSELLVAEAKCIPIAGSKMPVILQNLHEELRRAKILAKYLKGEEEKKFRAEHPEEGIKRGVYFLSYE